MKKTKKKGFTLVEIMIVVAIIGLLAAIGIPSIIGAYGNAQEKSKARNITEVEKAKAMLTLPDGSSGHPTIHSQTNGAAVADATIETLLNLKAISDLDVGEEKLTVNPIGTRAEYE
jgi:prepilin-type N-terminal cleavage/methylation domain-containing protein